MRANSPSTVAFASMAVPEARKRSRSAGLTRYLRPPALAAGSTPRRIHSRTVLGFARHRSATCSTVRRAKGRRAGSAGARRGMCSSRAARTSSRTTWRMVSSMVVLLASTMERSKLHPQHVAAADGGNGAVPYATADGREADLEGVGRLADRDHGRRKRTAEAFDLLSESMEFGLERQQLDL